MIRRLTHLIFGAELDRALHPVILVTLVGSLAGSAAWVFMGVWAVKELGASSAQLSYGYLVGAVVAGVVGYVAGHLSDVFGRRRLIVIGQGIRAFYLLLFLTPGDDVILGLAFMVGAAGLGSLGGSASQAMVADLVPDERREQAYASVRVAANLGVTMGPPVGSVFLIVGGWTMFFVSACLLSVAAWLIAYRYLPERGEYAPEGPPERGSMRVILADRTFLLFMGASTIAWIVYVAYETVLPISLVETHGIPEWGWGLLVVVNPLLVTLFQVRLTRRVLRYGVVSKWVVSMLLMGLPFLLLGLSSAIPLILVVLVLFVIGEMLWVPTSQSTVAHIAPADLRGAYMGIFGGAAATGFALAPFLGLQVRSEAGDLGMWAAFAAAAVVAALLGAFACARAARRPVEDGPSAVLQA